MPPLTRSPGAQRPSVRASALRLTTTYDPAQANQELGLEHELPSVAWVLTDALAAVTPPADPTALGSWLTQLRQQGISVLVSLDPGLGISPAVLARYHMHAVVCPVTSANRLAGSAFPVDTALALCGGLLRLLRQGERVAVHCDITLERTALVSSALLLWMGRPLHEALEVARGLTLADQATSEHRRFLAEFQVALAQTELAGVSWSRKYVVSARK